jgi:hypothetical protein
MKKHYLPPTTSLIKTDFNLLLNIPVSGTTTPDDSDAKPYYYDLDGEEDPWDSHWDLDGLSVFEEDFNL